MKRARRAQQQKSCVEALFLKVGNGGEGGILTQELLVSYHHFSDMRERQHGH
jgi:hypothetical protein